MSLGVPLPTLSTRPGPFPLTSEAKMEPPIQGLNLRSMVLLLAMSFRRMLCGEKGARGSRHVGSGKGQGLGGRKKPRGKKSALMDRKRHVWEGR